ncbi:hypothetical protein RMCBS344292_17710 [Rhizopus microsporus]|nr:hypothetical protein RMCBS344292_01440 [Rhizopus microsporus]CEJ03731.1 hypothetical protein RMCBS344292_17710 [Rhizopus microsporus]
MARISQICLALLAVAFTATSAAPCYDGQSSVSTVNSNGSVTPITQVDITKDADIDNDEAENDGDDASDAVDTSVDVDASVDDSVDGSLDDSVNASDDTSDNVSDNVNASIDVDAEATTDSAPCVDGDSTDITNVSTDDIKDTIDVITGHSSTSVTHGANSVVAAADGVNRNSLLGVTTGYIGTGPINLDNLATNALSSGNFGDGIYQAQANRAPSVTSVESGNGGGLLDITAGYVGTGPISADNALTNLLASRSNGPFYAQSAGSSDALSTVDVSDGNSASVANIDAGYVGTGVITADNLGTNLLSGDGTNGGLLNRIL